MKDRDEHGRFVKGNKVSTGRPRGNPLLMDVQKKELTPARWRKIVKKAIEDAIKGDRFARAWLGDYALGKPVQPVETLPKEELSDELQRDLDRVYGDSPESGLSEGSD